MFNFEKWVENKFSKEDKGREATNTVLMPSFWKHVFFTLEVMAPLVWCFVMRVVKENKL